jgi:hypothetical protein
MSVLYDIEYHTTLIEERVTRVGLQDFGLRACGAVRVTWFLLSNSLLEDELFWGGRDLHDSHDIGCYTKH